MDCKSTSSTVPPFILTSTSVPDGLTNVTSVIGCPSSDQPPEPAALLRNSEPSGNLRTSISLDGIEYPASATLTVRVPSPAMTAPHAFAVPEDAMRIEPNGRSSTTG